MFSSNASQVSDSATYIEDVFSTYLYTGNGSTQTITNGIDLAGEGGLVWLKQRDLALDHLLMDSARGATNYLSSNTTSGQNAGAPVTFTSIGLSIASGGAFWNQSSNKYASWTFRKQPKFFDVVTYTGNAAASQTISHNLGSAPGFMIVKATNTTGFWHCYHRSLGATKAMTLNTTDAESTLTNYWFNTAPTSTQFTVGTVSNDSGVTYVAYLFAHNAGGFGLTGTDNVVSCGSYTGNGSASGPVVTLGYEPQFVIIKCTTTGHNWMMMDTMRGMPTLPLYSTIFRPNQSAAEDSGLVVSVTPTATGFQLTSNYAETNQSGATFIYIAVRRGPMKVPESGTSVFGLAAAATQPVIVSTPPAPDMAISRIRGSANVEWNSAVSDRLRLRGSVTSSTAAEVATNTTLRFTYSQAFEGSITALPTVWYTFKRAPGFMDVCCYTGTGSLRTVSHNLAAAPELMIIKSRNGTRVWRVYSRALTANAELSLNSTAAVSYTAANFNNTDPTSSVFTVNTNSAVNAATDNYVAYLFTTCPGVSKVGSYTGTGTTQQINCGFTGGARFVMIKRTDSTGDWYVWDTARGIVAGNDPYFFLNTTAVEVTTTDYVDTFSSGFEISSTAPAAINASGGTFIFLAIA